MKSPYYIIRNKVIFEHLEKYKDTSTHSIAKILYRDYPQFFTNKEQARSIVRMYRGANGVRCREGIKQTKYYKNV